MAIKTKWYAIDVKNESAELSIFDEIGGFGISSAQFKEEFDLVRDKKSIHLMLNSPGGSITDGMAMYNILSSVRAKLSIEVLGMAASMASVIALAGKELIMDEGTYLMIHNPWVTTYGDAAQLRKDAAVLDKMRGELLNIYQAHSNLSPEKIGEMMDDETWMTAEEAQAYGFAQTVSPDSHAAAYAHHNLSKIGFKNIPQLLVEKALWKDVKTIRDFEQFLRDAGASRQDAEAIASAGWPRKQGDPASGADEVKAVIAAMSAAGNSLK
jgi:ATP-dependent Clp endopeptidase proteolytic subunit ClpP